MDNFKYHEVWKNPKTGRNKKHIYTLDDKPLYGITSVLNVIAKPALYQWYANMTADYIKAWATELLKDVDDGNGYLRDGIFETIEEARYAANNKKDNAADIGTIAHKMVEMYVSGTPVLIDEAIRLVVEEDGKKMKEFTEDEKKKTLVMYQNFVNWALQYNVKFLSSEKKIYSRTHWIAGTCDLVLEMNGKKYVGDVKTYSGIYDRTPFFQCAGYRLMLEEMGETDFDGSIIIRLGKDGSFDTHESMDYATDKKGFVAALDLFKALETFEK